MRGSEVLLPFFCWMSCVCPGVGGCLWTADILSCSGLGLDLLPTQMPVSGLTIDLSHNLLTQLKSSSFQGLSRLEVLHLAHNRLCVIQPGAFQNASGSRLRYLDLSSNQLHLLEDHYFSDLPGLEELLLFNNRIVRVESGALNAPARLRKVYLSHNRITDFPFFSIHQQTQPVLSLLDLSSNRLSKLPLQDISNLPASLQKGLYLHNNSLLCDCSMFQLFQTWKRMGFSSVTDFQQDHVCLVYGMERGAVRFFQHQRYFEACEDGLVHQEGSVSVRLGQSLLLHCATALSGHNLTVVWVSPGQEYLVPPGNHGSLKVYANGSLQIVAARAEDSGIYWCMALDRHRRRNDTREVNVTVVAPHHGRAHEHFNTGFTTLLGCTVSLLLVLMYLYLTPCHCPARTGATPAGSQDGAPGCIQTSILSPTPPSTTEGPAHKVSTNKHVVFAEPIKEQQNGRVRAGPAGPEEQSDLRGAGLTHTNTFTFTPILSP